MHEISKNLVWSFTIFFFFHIGNLLIIFFFNTKEFLDIIETCETIRSNRNVIVHEIPYLYKNSDNLINIIKTNLSSELDQHNAFKVIEYLKNYFNDNIIIKIWWQWLINKNIFLFFNFFNYCGLYYFL